MSKILTTLLLTLWLIVGAAWAGDVEDGNAALLRKDYATALIKYKRAAAQGKAIAQSNLGVMYSKGQGVVQDYAEAVRWWKLAAEQGTAAAHGALGFMYGEGQGVVQDYMRAHMWYNLAAIKGDSVEVKNRDIVANKMTSQQIAEAQKLARECQARNFKNCD